MLMERDPHSPRPLHLPQLDSSIIPTTHPPFPHILHVGPMTAMTKSHQHPRRTTVSKAETMTIPRSGILRSQCCAEVKRRSISHPPSKLTAPSCANNRIRPRLNREDRHNKDSNSTTIKLQPHPQVKRDERSSCVGLGFVVRVPFSLPLLQPKLFLWLLFVTISTHMLSTRRRQASETN